MPASGGSNLPTCNLTHYFVVYKQCVSLSVLLMEHVFQEKEAHVDIDY